MKQDVTMKGLREYGRVTSVFKYDYPEEDFEELDDKALLGIADGLIIRIKGTKYYIEVTAVMDVPESLHSRPSVARARLHFRKWVDV